MRPIDADSLKIKIDFEHYFGDKEVTFSADQKEALIQVIDNAPTIDVVTKWIPCSERLPSEYEEVLVCDKDGTMEVCDLETFGRGVGLKWTDKNGYECWLDVIAWMPLPKPYGERKGE